MIQPGHILAAVLAFGVFIAFGPEAIGLPGYPQGRIKDVDSSLTSPPSRELQGVLAPNTLLHQATVLFNNTLKSSESVHVRADGSLLLLDKYGYVFKAVPDSKAPGGYSLVEKPLAHMGVGRPLGFKEDGHGNVIVCMAGAGLMRLYLPNEEGGRARVELLGARVSADSPNDPNSHILYANALDISKEGVIYFSDSQAVPVLMNWASAGKQPAWYDTFNSFFQGLYTGQASGRLLAYYPNNGSIHCLVSGFFFPNGVALSEDESYLVLAETNKFRLLRYWLKGEKAGSLDILVDKLPGFPDGVSRAAGGKGFWAALPVPRTDLFDILMKVRGLRVLLAYLPPSLRPALKKWGAAVLVSPQGEITRFLHDPTGVNLRTISDVVEQPLPEGGTRMWFGNVNQHYVAYWDPPVAW